MAPPAETPIAVFLYRRPHHAERMLASLAACEEIERCRVVFYCDGPKGADDEAAVRAARRVAQDWARRLGAQVVERPENLGLARSIVTGVTELCQRYGRVIVVEDDLVLDPAFVRYATDGLNRYEGDPRVFGVSGYMFPVEHPPDSDALFLALATIWGWGTWARAWRSFTWEPLEALEALSEPKLRKAFDLGNSYPYSSMLEDRLAGRNDSWDILWWWAVFKQGGLFLHPRHSLVWNVGFDGTGTHCPVDGQLGSPGPPGSATQWWPQEPRFPEAVQGDVEALRRVCAFLKRHYSPRRSLSWSGFARRLQRSGRWRHWGRPSAR